MSYPPPPPGGGAGVGAAGRGRMASKDGNEEGAGGALLEPIMLARLRKHESK